MIIDVRCIAEAERANNTANDMFDHVLIIIASPGEKTSFIENANPHCRCMLRVEFDDVDEAKDGLVPITDGIAYHILDFVRAFVLLGVDGAIVCCRGGVSRSAGVGAALSMIYNGWDLGLFQRKVPNMKVYSTILSVHDRLAHQFDHF